LRVVNKLPTLHGFVSPRGSVSQPMAPLTNRIYPDTPLWFSLSFCITGE